MASHGQLAKIVPLLACLWFSACNRHDPKRAEQAVREIQAGLEHGPLDQALSLATRTARRWSDRDQSETYLRLKLLEAEILLRKGGQAEPANRSLSGLRISPDLPKLEVQREVLLGQSWISLQKYSDAEQALERACRLAVELNWDEPLFRALILKGQLAQRREQMDAAEAHFRLALKLAEERRDRSERMTALLDIGFLLAKRSRYDDAAPYFEKALAEQSPAELQAASVALQNLAICYERLGDFDAALKRIKQAISIQQQMNAQGNLVSSYGELGNIYVDQGEAQRAVPYYNQALQLALKLGSHHQIELTSLDLATAHIELREWDEAARLNRQAQAMEERSHEDGNAPYRQLNSAAIAAGRGEDAAAIRQFGELVDAPRKLPPGITWEAHAGLARLYAKAGDGEQAGRHSQSALQIIEKTRSELSRNESKITFLSRLIHFYQEYVDLLIDQGDSGHALEIADSSRARLLAERLDAGGPGAAAAPSLDLPTLARSSNAILISYWIAPRRSVAWVVTPDGVHLQPLPESAGTLQSLVDSYSNEIEHDMRDTVKTGSEAGARLYAALVAPIRPYLVPGGRIIIVPDGPLHNLNFETLPVPGGRSHYWIEDVTLSVAPSLAVLGEKAGKQSGGGGVLLIGNPKPNEQFPSLPHAEQEIESIRGHFPSRGTKVFMGAEATPSLYRGSHPEQYSFIHFTAHAESNRESPLDSAVILSPQNDEYKLYGRDVMATGLHARLVTVSACQSAGAKSYAGEGLVGFAWAFLHAGAHNVVAGLWDVDDSSTARLMDRMYAGLAAGDAPDRALRDAKLSLIRGTSVNYRKPYYWGALQVFRRTAQ